MGGRLFIASIPPYKDEMAALVKSLIVRTQKAGVQVELSASIEPGTIEEKKLFYRDAMEKNWILFFEHDPDIVACTIQHDGKHYKKKDTINFNKY